MICRARDVRLQRIIQWHRDVSKLRVGPCRQCLRHRRHGFHIVPQAVALSLRARHVLKNGFRQAELSDRVRPRHSAWTELQTA
jgi:hypothetical protein